MLVTGGDYTILYQVNTNIFVSFLCCINSIINIYYSIIILYRQHTIGTHDKTNTYVDMNHVIVIFVVRKYQDLNLGYK